MHIHSLIFVLFTISGLSAHAEDRMYIEDPALSPLPAEVEAAVTGREGLLDINTEEPCKLVGKPVNLARWVESTDYFITTADSCGWGSVGGPIWFVRDTGKGYQTVLATGGYSVKFSLRSRNGMRGLIVAYKTDDELKRKGWRFDGKQYFQKFEHSRALSPEQ